MKIAREEIFGPVMSILKFKDVDEVVERGNRTFYGLAAAVWTKDITKAIRMANRLRAGTVWVNCFDVFDAGGAVRRLQDVRHRPRTGAVRAAALHGSEDRDDRDVRCSQPSRERERPEFFLRSLTLPARQIRLDYSNFHRMSESASFT